MDRNVPAAGLTALSIEFVSKPQEAYRLRNAIPAVIENALGHVAGFAGCMLLISDREARLVTLITFWEGENRGRLAGNSAAWIHKLLAPFVDHCLQVRSHNCFPANGFGLCGMPGEGQHAGVERFSAPAAYERFTQ